MKITPQALVWSWYYPEYDMSEPLVVSIPHRLGKDEALRRLKAGLAQVGTSFGHLFSVREQIWIGTTFAFRSAPWVSRQAVQSM
jgi:hypothetical protein